MEESVGSEQSFGTFYLALGDAGAEPHEFLLDIEHHIFDLKGIRHKVNAPQTSVLKKPNIVSHRILTLIKNTEKINRFKSGDVRGSCNNSGKFFTIFNMKIGKLAL